jgi:hypothetical protein
MPDLGATDPRAELDFSRQLEQPRRVAPQPFLGCTCYPVWYREQQLEKWNAGEVTDVSELSLFRWSGRLEPYRQTGNRERSQIIGTELLNLITYRLGVARPFLMLKALFLILPLILPFKH